MELHNVLSWESFLTYLGSLIIHQLSYSVLRFLLPTLDISAEELKLRLRTLISHYEIVDVQTELIKPVAGLLTIYSKLKMTLKLNWKWELMNCDGV